MDFVRNLKFIRDLDVKIQADSGLLQVLLGPRQVGKTSTVLDYLERTHAGSFHYVSADQEIHTGDPWIRQHWDYALSRQQLLVIDEIQKCENWSETLKALWDLAKRNKKHARCLVLGSSSLKIQKGLSESLTGRFQLTHAHHWNVTESAQGYGLSFEDFLKYGGYPGSYQFLSDGNQWRDYVALSIIGTVIEKDILQFHNVRSPALFKQAYEIISAFPAMEISYNKLLGQLQSRGNVELIKHYLELYQGAFLIGCLGKYAANAIRIKSSSPKIIPLAPCLYFVNHLKDYDSDERGHIFEALVGSQLVRTGESVYYWREGKFEVDFVVKRGRSVWAIEVKSGRRKVFDGVKAFCKVHHEAKSVLITPDIYLEFEADPLKFLAAYEM